MKHLNIKVFGLVQGVGFRYSAKNTALDLNIVGLARNEKDGTLYLEIEGEEENLQEFTTWLEKGTNFAQIERVEIVESNLKNFADFKIY